MDNILGDKPSTQPPVLVDTLDQNDEDAENSIGDTSASTAASNGKDDVTDSNSLCDADSHSTTTPERKKKIICEDKVMKDVVEQLITAQQESDERFMQLEEKRIKLEEWQFQREERERKEDREFKLRMR